MLRHNSMKKKVVNIDGDPTTADIVGFLEIYESCFKIIKINNNKKRE